MNKLLYLFLFLLIIPVSSCFTQEQSDTDASVVELRNNDGTYRLFLNDEPFYVNGAGLEHGNIENLASHGANSFRTWRTDNGKKSAKEVLDEAHKYGLMVLMGIEIGRERHGYDYNDTAWVRSQYEDVKKQVLEIKDHPALLAWAIGNELNHHSKNDKVWVAVNDISKMIHEIDGNHPTTTTFAGFSKKNAKDFKKYCTDVDFVSIQMYGDIINLQTRIKEAGYDGPYMVTEWGATGHWEMPATKYGIPIEQTSSEKAKSVKERWDKAISIDKKRCLGSYIFLWGQKHERTPTWYGLFTEHNYETQVIDVMHEVWKGSKPDNVCPELTEILINEKSRFDNICLNLNTEHILNIKAVDNDNDKLEMSIEILEDIPDSYREGGDYEQKPEALFKTEKIPYSESFTFNSPSKEGTYRILIYITDGNNNAATANVPFYVTADCDK